MIAFALGRANSCRVLARPGPAEVLTIRQLSGGKRTDLKRAALSRFVRTRLDSVPRGRISALVPINALPGSKSRRATPPTTCIKHIPPRPRRTRKLEHFPLDVNRNDHGA